MTRPDHAMPDEPQDDALIGRCRAGDGGAFRALYVLHFPAVQRLARRLGTPPSEVDDVTQEVFAAAFAKLDRFGGGRFDHWVHRICANVVTDHHRRRRVRESFGWLLRSAPELDVSTGPSPERAASAREAEVRVGEILARMRPKQREVFALFELEGLSGEEIAERVGCPLGTVWTRLHHARAAFVRIGRKRGWLDERGAT